MAYAAVISLKHTINGLLNSSHISPVSSTREIFEFAYNQTTVLQQVLDRLNDSRRRSSERLDALEGQIRDCAHKLEDVLEFHELDQLHSQEKNYEDDEGDLEELRQEITSFAETVKKMEKDYIEELSRDDDDDDAAIVSSNIDFGVEMVGNSHEFTSIRSHLLRRMRPDDMWFFSFLGENGSGRTMVAKTIFEDLRKGGEQFFDCYAWVNVGTKHILKEVLLDILAQVDAAEYELLISSEDEKVRNYFYKILEHRRYMIVLDDVRDVQMVHYLRKSLPDQSNGSIVCLTTSLKEVARLSDGFCSFEVPTARFFEAIWSSIHGLVFHFKSISPELEEAARMIIENCRCLYILAAKALLFLIRNEKRPEEWSKIAADKENPFFMVADEIAEISKIKTEMQSYNWDGNVKRREIYFRWISTCVDLPNFVHLIKMEMHPERFFSKMQIISLLGMAGIGKTTLARNLFNDESNLSHFDHHVWVTIGQKYHKEDILIDILAQIYPDIDKLHMKGDEELARGLCVQLSCKRCLIVLDDLWSKEPLHHLKHLFPDIKGAILVTTTLADVAKFGRDDIDMEMELLDKEESWSLLCQKVFAGGLCPPELEKAGRKIAENCEGLPLLILTVAEQLLKVEISQELWNNVASGKQKSVFMNAHHQISEALLPSYESLAQYQKACFLYMGVFREKYEIFIYKLTILLIAEGFLEAYGPQTIEDYIAECLYELVDRSLVMVQCKFSDLQIKTCRLHPVFWHLVNSEAMKNNFFHAMNSYDDCFIEGMESQRRLCIRNNILLGIEDVQNSMASIISAHSLLCVSPLEQYPVPLNFDMRLLRVMNAVTIRLYEFPVEVVRLVHLRYLGLTCNGKLPTSISNLWKLQYLILKRYMNIKSSENSWALPVEIWDMKELKHLEVMGGCLPDHKCGSGLLNLSALLDVSAQSCREEVLKWIPNLKRLGIRIELAPDDDGHSFRYLNNIHHLPELESLKCIVVNPQIRPEVVPSVFDFPSNLKKLSLSGLGYPWEYMSLIGELRNLEVLKLKRYAFQGPKWEMDSSSQFTKLKFLLVEDTNLVQWKANSPISMKLERLCIRHCYKLQLLPIPVKIRRLREMKIVDCSSLTLSWAEQVGEMLTACQVQVHLSWLKPTKNDSQ